ncbi:transcriptional regulator NrdR [Candidatus Shapirobacteria bacterium CG10_big_fil_rev_8_21_14_0_10_40_9]|uniref:Transcriptional repressor NrdR n=1 Tax=Candidatus Shapirobacteria bacterium CG10_big_fil_rev_8_21_14_0_10_40_9 TaxID=1974888 RepID=A0A2M8L300_9BACT|nr:MAG: transcriptional regulator NrdR [Candidatus Shapirobacteria bacterium CG10_big_fil_rev_8_21_14_0_10_40_9]
MKCPFCGHEETIVLESRISEDGNSFRRRRECAKCKKRFTTYERAERTLLVIKKDGRREQFDREKIKKGILLACHKRPVSLDLIDNIVDEVEQELLRKDSAEISSKTIGNAVLKRLKKADKVAWLRFASVYLEFSDLGDFERVIEKIS